MSQRLLRAYALVFAVTGLAFLAAPGLVLQCLNLAAALLPQARPLSDGGPSLWLALTGSMMAMISYLSLEAARDPGQEAAWNALFLSKAMSTALFIAFSCASRNSLFLVAALVDGSIFFHLRWLRARGGPTSPPPLRSRFPSEGPFYEVWFAKFNDPKTRNALWLRYTLLRGAGVDEASCWYVLFDKAAGKTFSGRWRQPRERCLPADGEVFALDKSVLRERRMTGENESASWDFSWTRGEAPPFQFVPRLLALTGLPSSEYSTPASAARFDGAFKLNGKEYSFRGAPGCLGHVLGRSMARRWAWAHAVLPGKNGSETVLELLWAEAQAGGVSLPALTFANLWHEGRLRESIGILRGLRNSSRRDGDRWRFRVDFGDLVAEGECAPALTAELDYESPDGRKLVCRNSKNGSMSVVLSGSTAAELRTEDAAAVEYAEDRA